MPSSLEERLFNAERLLASLLRERAGVATDSDLHLLQSAGIAFGRMVREPAPVQAATPVAGAEPWQPRTAPPPPPHAPAPPRAAPVREAWQADRYAGADAYIEDDLVPGPRRHEPVEMEPSPTERWIAAQMKATPGDWIARAGMALLLLGIAFLCKYSIDRGWITPALRVSAGAAAGVALVVVGCHTHRASRRFSALFMGGGIGALYTAGFAAYEMYHLLPFPVAFALMAATTAAAFGLAMWSGIEMLAIVGTLGGIATPFVLSASHPSVPGFVAYLLCILALGSGTYLGWRWRKSFVVATVGTWVALGTAVATLPAAGATEPRIALTAGFAAVLLAGWAVFLLPRVWPARFPATAGEQAAHAWWARAMNVSVERVRVTEGYLAVLAPFAVAWPSLATAWTLSSRGSGWLALGMMAVTGLAFAALRRPHPALGRAHAFAAAVAGTLSLVALSDTVIEVVIAASVYGLLLHVFAAREPLGRPLRLLAHAILACAAMAVAEPIMSPTQPMVRLALLVVAACAYAVAAGRVSGLSRELRDVYRLGGHTVAAVLLVALCWPLAAAGGWVAVSFAAFAAALCWLEARPEGAAAISGRPVDGIAAIGLQAGALVVLWGFCGAFGAGAFAWFNQRAAAEVALIASLAAGALLAGPGRRRRAMAGVGYALWLFAAADQFAGMEGGAALTTGAWAATGLVLLLAALRDRVQTGVRVALGTLALVCAKLFMVDLANLDPVWRILLFMGVGAAFLAVSYYVRSAWLADAPEAEPADRVSLAGQ